MPETRERPAGEDGAATEDTISTIVADVAHVPEQLRRRRAASLRCVPLDSGHRDPWRYPPPTGPRVLEASRDAWSHLAELGYIPDDPAGRAWMAAVLGVAA